MVYAYRPVFLTENIQFILLEIIKIWALRISWQALFLADSPLRDMVQTLILSENGVLLNWKNSVHPIFQLIILDIRKKLIDAIVAS